MDEQVEIGSKVLLDIITTDLGRELHAAVKIGRFLPSHGFECWHKLRGLELSGFIYYSHAVGDWCVCIEMPDEQHWPKRITSDPESN